ncbi:winged helix-turn-helix domain-containing protein [Azospirillum oleiclasticum]
MPLFFPLVCWYHGPNNSDEPAAAMARLRLRIDFSPSGSVGPGKIRLLELIGDTGSISAAARALEMSYRRAWLLIDDLNQLFREPVVSASAGGRKGGGAELTAFGRTLIDEYRAIEAEAHEAVSARLARLQESAVGGGCDVPEGERRFACRAS